MVKMTEAGVHQAARARRGASAVDVSAGTSSTRWGLVGAAIGPSGRVGAVGERWLHQICDRVLFYRLYSRMNANIKP